MGERLHRRFQGRTLLLGGPGGERLGRGVEVAHQQQPLLILSLARLQAKAPLAGAHRHQLAHQGDGAVGQGDRPVVGGTLIQRQRQGFDQVLLDHFELDPHRFGLGAHPRLRGAGSIPGGRQRLELRQIIPVRLGQALRAVQRRIEGCLDHLHGGQHLLPSGLLPASLIGLFGSPRLENPGVGRGDRRQPGFAVQYRLQAEQRRAGQQQGHATEQAEAQRQQGADREMAQLKSSRTHSSCSP
ncbi:hypothetical protein FQZ97_886920 [compost metagenome]